MKDAVQNMREQIADSRIRVLELETRLAALPTDSGPETLALYQNLLAKEKKFQERMILALAPPPRQTKRPVLRIGVVALALIYFIYLLLFK